jgi:hypothetical protein
MSALPIGIVLFVIGALGAICPAQWIYVPALLLIVISGGFIGGTIFSMQSDGVYELRIRRGSRESQRATVAIGGVWEYGFVGVAAGMIGLLIAARIIGVGAPEVAKALTLDPGTTPVGGAASRLFTSVGVFSVALIAGFLGLNLIRMVSDKVREEIQKKIQEEFKEKLTPERLADRARELLENHAYEAAVQVYRELAGYEQTLRSFIGQAMAMRRLGRLDDAIGCLDEGIRSRAQADGDPYRRAIAYWNRACYKSMKYKDNINDEHVRSILADLDSSLQNEPGFKHSLRDPDFDEDLRPLLGNPTFEQWRKKTLGG